MKRRGVCVLILCLTLFLTGCAPRGGRLRAFGYLDAPVALSVTGQLDGVPFSALLQGGGATGGEVDTRTASFTLTYLSPAALAGVTVRYDAPSGQTVLALGELKATGAAYEALALPGLVLMRESAVVSSRRQEGTSGVTVILHTADGAARTYDAQTGNPSHVSVTTDGRTLDMSVTVSGQ